VRALLAGTKTQTRRVFHDPAGWGSDVVYTKITGPAIWPLYANGNQCGPPAASPLIKPGDRLYVREHWRAHFIHDGTKPRDMPADTKPIIYVADEVDGSYAKSRGKFRQAMHMPRWASRLTLHVTGVKVERLQEISEEDAIAEGIEKVSYTGNDPQFAGAFGWKAYDLLSDGSEHPHNAAPYATAVRSYQSLWDSLRMKTGNVKSLWKSNPWVACFEFRIYRSNIDHLIELERSGK
jgi:hypothetical protein